MTPSSALPGTCRFSPHRTSSVSIEDWTLAFRSCDLLHCFRAPRPLLRRFRAPVRPNLPARLPA